MVVFNEDSFTITVKTVTNPIEDWLGLHEQIISILASVDGNDCVQTPWLLINLLHDMMPDWETAKKMTE